MTEKDEPLQAGSDQPPQPSGGPRSRRSRKRRTPEPNETVVEREVVEAAPAEASVTEAPDQESSPLAEDKPKRPKRRRKEKAEAPAAAAGPVTAEDEARPATEPLVAVANLEKPWRIRLGFARPQRTDEPGALSPRRILFRDTSALLMVMALLVFLVGQPSEKLAAQDDDIRGAVATNATLPAGTLDLLNPTIEPTLPEDTARPTFTVGRATLPPWCGDPQCSFFVTPSPTPKPIPKPTKKPPAPTPTPCDPLDPLCPTPAPTPTPVPTNTPAPTAPTDPPTDPPTNPPPEGGTTETPVP